MHKDAQEQYYEFLDFSSHYINAIICDMLVLL